MTVDPFFDSGQLDEQGPHRIALDARSVSVGGPKTMGLFRYAHLLGDLIYSIDQRHRTIVRRNLKFAFPHWTDYQITHVSRQAFRNLGRLVTEIFQLAYRSRNDILSRCQLNGAEHFQHALESGRGMVLVSAHLGNWEIGLQYLACRFGKPILLLVRPFSPAPLDRWMNAIRARFGNQTISKKNALSSTRAMLKTIHQGGIVGIMADVSHRKASVAVNFFNHRVRANYAAALLAVRCNTPVIAAFCTRNADGSFTINIPPPIAIKRSGNLKHLLKLNTQHITDAAEAAVHRQPEQYLWMQKRWKDYHPHLYPGYRPRSEFLEEE